MSALETKVAFPQIQEFYITLDEFNLGYYKAKVDGQNLHL